MRLQIYSNSMELPLTFVLIFQDCRITGVSIFARPPKLWTGHTVTPPFGGFLNRWYPTIIGFHTKNYNFGVFWGYHHFRKHSFQNMHQLFPRGILGNPPSATHKQQIRMAKQQYILVFVNVHFDGVYNNYRTLQNMLSYVHFVKIQTKAIEQEKTFRVKIEGNALWGQYTTKAAYQLITNLVEISQLVTGFAMGIHCISPVETHHLKHVERKTWFWGPGHLCLNSAPPGDIHRKTWPIWPKKSCSSTRAGFSLQPHSVSCCNSCEDKTCANGEAYRKFGKKKDEQTEQMYHETCVLGLGEGLVASMASQCRRNEIFPVFREKHESTFGKYWSFRFQNHLLR